MTVPVQGGPALPVYLINEQVRTVSSQADYDQISNALVTMDVVHAVIHDQLFYTVTDYDSSVDTAAPKYWRLTTPATGYVHIVAGVSMSGAGLVEVYENPTLSGAGTALTAMNNYRPSSNTATVTATADPTTSNDGTRIFVQYLGSNAPGARFGGTLRQAAEFVLKQNEDYIFKVTPVSNSTAVSIVLELYVRA